MWRQPDNIPSTDWQNLTQEWIDRRDAVYERFHDFDPKIDTKDIDGIMSGLLGLYYTAEQHEADEASFAIQLRDEFHKGFWIEGKIIEMEKKYPKLTQPHDVRYEDDIRPGTAADKCMGGIISAFIDMTKAVCTERFGKPFGDNDKALRNGVMERSSWTSVIAGYEQELETYRTALRTNPNAKQPSIYRQ